MKGTAVVDDFECHLKCSGNSSCLSVNVHPGTNNGKRICELSNETRLTKPGDFKKKKGSNYYGSVKVSSSKLIFKAGCKPSIFRRFSGGGSKTSRFLFHVPLHPVSFAPDSLPFPACLCYLRVSGILRFLRL